MIITIYTTRTEDHYRLGSPAAHGLEEPSGISRAWIARASYLLPDGYTVSRCNGGTLEVYNPSGKHCGLVDSQYYRRGGGTPMLIDSDLRRPFIRLEKVGDLPWD